MKTVLFIGAVSVCGAGGAGYFHGKRSAAASRALVENSKPEITIVQNGQPGSGLPTSSAKASPINAWATRIEKATAEDFPKLAMEISAVEDAPLRDKLNRLFCARWAEVDPATGLAFFAGDTEAGCRTWLLTEWAMLDIDAAWLATESLGDKAKGERHSIGSALLQENIELFWQWFVRAREPLPRTGESSEAWRTVVRAHLAELETLASELSAQPKKDSALARLNTPAHAGLLELIAAIKAEQDPHAALEWAKKTPDATRNNALVSVIRALAKSDPTAAANALELLKDQQRSSNVFIGSGREQLLEEIALAMGRRDPRGAIDWLAKNPSLSHRAVEPVREVVNQAIAQGQLTPQEAFELVRATKSKGDVIQVNVLRQMWDVLSPEQIPDMAVWLKNHESTESKRWALDGLIGTWSQRDPVAAVGFARSIEDTGLRQELLGELLSRRSQSGSDIDAAAKALATFPPDDRAEIISGFLQDQYGVSQLEWDSSQPRFDGKIFGDAVAELPTSASREKAMAAVASRWGATDPFGALAWTAAQPEAELRRQAVGAVIEGWAAQDSWGASQWLAAQPAGTERDAAAHQLARVVREAEPDSAWAWALSIGDADVRTEAQCAVLRKWRDSDLAAAQAAVDSLNDLPDSAMQRLADTLERRDQKK